MIVYKRGGGRGREGEGGEGNIYRYFTLETCLEQSSEWRPWMKVKAVAACHNEMWDLEMKRWKKQDVQHNYQ